MTSAAEVEARWHAVYADAIRDVGRAERAAALAELRAGLTEQVCKAVVTIHDAIEHQFLTRRFFPYEVFGLSCTVSSWWEDRFYSTRRAWFRAEEALTSANHRLAMLGDPP